MYEYDEEPCYEPTLADVIMMEYQQKMKDALLESVKQDIESVKQENAYLKEQNYKLNEKVKEIAERERELENKKSNLERQVRSERLSSLMKDFKVVMYAEERAYVDLPKCGNCNENRKIEFISPLGRKTTEPCTCNVRKTVYAVREYILTEFKISDHKDMMAMWYKIKEDSRHDYASHNRTIYAEMIYSEDMKFEDIGSQDVFFKSKDDCQKYCDWLNSKEVS